MTDEKEQDNADEHPGDALIPLDPVFFPLVRKSMTGSDRLVQLLINLMGAEYQHKCWYDNHEDRRDDA